MKEFDMWKKIMIPLFLLSSMLVAQADNTFELTNKTGLEIASIQFGPYDTTDQWGPNALTAALADGQSAKLTFVPHTQAEDWDIRVVDSNGEEIIFYMVPVPTIKKVALRYTDYVPESDYE